MLGEAMAGVAAQTRPPAFLAVGVNYSPDRIDAATHANRLTAAVDEEWLAFLHDDDVWLPDHLEGLAAASEDADVVVADFVVEGRDWHPGHSCDFSQLRTRNWFGPSAVMIRSKTFRATGGWPQKVGEIWGDWGMWLSLLDHGARFRCSHRTTVRYRFHDSNMTFESGAPPLPLGRGLRQHQWSEGYSDDGWAGPWLSLALALTEPVGSLVIRGWQPEGSPGPAILGVKVDGEPTPHLLSRHGCFFEVVVPVERGAEENLRLRMETMPDPTSMAGRSAEDRRELSFQLIEVRAEPRNQGAVRDCESTT